METILPTSLYQLCTKQLLAQKKQQISASNLPQKRFCQPHSTNCIRSSCWRKESSRVQRPICYGNGGSTSVESPATAAKEASTAAIQFEGPIISIPHLVRRAQLLNNAAFDDSRFQRWICAKRTPYKYHSHVFERCFGTT